MGRTLHPQTGDTNTEEPAREASGPVTFVLVHGAWCGGFVYDEVADILRGRGHKVFTPTLTGLASREHLLSPDVDLDTHVTDVIKLIEWEELTSVVLAGHSYGGMVISGVAAQAPTGTIKSIVYLDAFCPDSGQSLADIVGEDVANAVHGDLDFVPFPPMLAEGDPGMQRIAHRLTPHPRKANFQRLGDVSMRERIPIKTFLRATEGFGPWFEATAERLAADPGWRVERIETGHAMMIENPEQTAEVLLRAAA